MGQIELFIVLLILTAVVAIGSRRLRLQYTLTLLIVGLLLGTFRITPPLALSSRVILLLFLPPLLFQAAFDLDLPLLWKRRRGILTLALPGVLLAMVIGGAIVHWTAALPWSLALLFGAMIAATDPIAVLATFR